MFRLRRKDLKLVTAVAPHEVGSILVFNTGAAYRVTATGLQQVPVTPVKPED